MLFEPAPVPSPRLSELESEPELSLSWEVGDLGHLPEVRAGDRRLRRRPDLAVEQIERLETELQPRSADGERTRHGDVLAEEPWAARVGVAHGRVAELRAQDAALVALELVDAVHGIAPERARIPPQIDERIEAVAGRRRPPAVVVEDRDPVVAAVQGETVPREHHEWIPRRVGMHARNTPPAQDLRERASCQEWLAGTEWELIAVVQLDDVRLVERR